MKLNIAIVQICIWDGEKERNLSNVLDILNSLSKLENLPDIVCFPELFTTGFDLANVKKYAESIPGDTIKKISKISRNKFIVIGSILESADDQFYNTAFILNKKGEIIGKYRKTHLFAIMLEKDFLSSGNEITSFILTELNNLRIGIAICYDLRFPELFRMQALDGAQIVFIPSEFPKPRRKIWKALIYARAIENQFFVVGVNRVGKGKSDDFFGYSMITNGEYIEHLGDAEEIKVFSIDLESLESIRKKLPLLKERRSDLYEV